MSRTPPSTASLRVADLSQSAPTAFSLRPDKDVLPAIAAEMGVTTLRKLSFAGHVEPQGREDWVLTGRLGATVIQPCVVTLEPVTTRIEADVRRTYLRNYEEPDEPEAEMPEDDSSERLGHWIDPEAVMLEALALNIPEYPRADGVELGSMQYAQAGIAPMTDEDARPFAGLSGLKQKLEENDD